MKDFKKWQKEHPNFITPDIVKVKQNNNRVVELSKGYGIDNKELFGVSVIIWNETKGTYETQYDSGLNKCFNSLKEAEEHFKVC